MHLKTTMTMKKAILLCVLTVISANMAFAQNFKHGYRGYADIGYTIGVGDYEFGRTEISTTHGYQVCPFFFVGGGIGFHFMEKYQTKGMGEFALDKRDAKFDIPVFLNLRGMLTKHKFGPFIDAKVGYFLTNGDGLYSNISLGVRMRTIGKQAVNLSVGYTFEQLKYETFGRFTHPGYDMDYTRNSRMLDSEGVSIKVGYEF